MSAFTAFIKKEFLGLFRSGKAVILLLISVLFGIMNPAIAKLTPWMMESMADSMAETGLVVTAVEVDAMTSWTQFYKNAPMALIVFLLMFAGILTSEYQSGTLIGMVTKGISRWKILAAKKIMVLIVWTVFFWLMYGITFGYNQYFWDQSKIEHRCKLLLYFRCVAGKPDLPQFRTCPDKHGCTGNDRWRFPHFLSSGNVSRHQQISSHRTSRGYECFNEICRNQRLPGITHCDYVSDPDSDHRSSDRIQ